MINLVYNEQLKLWRKKRLIVILALVAIIVAIFTYAQFRQHQEDEKQAGTSDWHVQTQQQIVDLENRLGTGRLPKNIKNILKCLSGNYNII